jgi:uncharacterized protein (DUF924 family)
MAYEKVLNFWFRDECQEKWFIRDKQFDDAISTLFRACWEAARQGELCSWRATLHGRLAEIIVLDQFSRNLNRNSAEAWSQDSMALVLSQEVLRQPQWQQLGKPQKAFLLMPWMHSESRLIHEKATELFEELGDPEFIRHEREHRDIIRKFGRYPHRNALLGRVSSAEEAAWLSGHSLPFF